MNMHTYAIGDIHGQLDLLKRAHDRIELDQERHGAAPVVHIGDLVDRGPDSAGVIDFLRNGLRTGQDWIVIKGNHDRMFNGFLDDPEWRDPGLRPDMSWLHPRIGGATTLAAYGIRHAADRPIPQVHAAAVDGVPPEHRAFLRALPTSLVRGDAVFVHAGLRPGIPLEDQSETDLVWIRQIFLEDPRDHGALVVHGHTAISQATHYGNRVNIDSGAAYGGPLSVVVIEGREAFELTASGRMRLFA
jgi:serine/threonine protein phosphatase 1